jgi:hypothetical protein
MTIPDYEYQRRVGFAQALADSQRRFMSGVLFGRLIVLAAAVAILGKAVEFAAKFIK